MNEDSIKSKLIEVLECIQRDSGYEVISITGQTCPLKDLEGFDSKIWPYAIGMLAKALGITIENNKNIYISTDGRRLLSIDESVEMIANAPAAKDKQ